MIESLYEVEGFPAGVPAERIRKAWGPAFTAVKVSASPRGVVLRYSREATEPSHPDRLPGIHRT